MKKITSICIIMILVLSACGSGNDESDKTTINILSQGVGDWDAKLVNVEEEFEKNNPEIDIVIDYVSFDQVFEITEAELNAESDKYDIFIVDGPYVASYAERGLLLPLDDYISEDSLSNLTESSLEAGTYKDMFYASPMNSSSQLMFYNKAVFDNLKINYPEEDVRMSWEEIVEISKEALDNNASEYGLIIEQVDRLYQVNAIPEDKGSKTIADDYVSVDGIWNSDQFISGMDFYYDIFEEGVSPRGFNADEQSAIADSMSYTFLWGGTWNVQKILDNGFGEEDFGYTLSPYFEGYEDEVTTPTGSWHVGINSFGDSEKFDKSASFIEYLTLGEGNDIWLSENNDVPATKSAIDEIVNNETYSDFPKSSQQLAAQEQIDTASTRPVTPYFPQYETVINQAFSDIRNGSEPKERLEQAVEQYNNVISEE